MTGVHSYWNWLVPRVNINAISTVMEHPELYNDDYMVMTGRSWSPITFGMEIEQAMPLLLSNPISQKLEVIRDDSGPGETSIGVYRTPIEMLRDFYDLTGGRPWPWCNDCYDSDLGRYVSCGSHIHVRPNFDEIMKNTSITSEAEAWAIVWNTMLDLSYVMLPLLVWGRPRENALLWASPWYEHGDSLVPHRWGRRSEQTFQYYVVNCEHHTCPCAISVEIKHIDDYKYLALSGTYGDMGYKPVTAEIRVAEVHPLFAAAFLKVAVRIVRLRLSVGSSAKIAERELLYRAVRSALQTGNVREVWKTTGPVTFVPGRSFWPDHLHNPPEKYRFRSLWQLFTTLLSKTIATKGTPYYRAARFVLAGCDPVAEAEATGGATFWEAIVAEPGRFRWRTCNVDTG